MRRKHDSLHLLHVLLEVDRDCHSFVGVVAGELAEGVIVVVEQSTHVVVLDDVEEASELGQDAHK
jgi:hypothetical protein